MWGHGTGGRSGKGQGQGRGHPVGRWEEAERSPCREAHLSPSRHPGGRACPQPLSSPRSLRRPGLYDEGRPSEQRNKCLGWRGSPRNAEMPLLSASEASRAASTVGRVLKNGAGPRGGDAGPEGGGPGPLADRPAAGASRPQTSGGDPAHSCLGDAVARWPACVLSLTEPVLPSWGGGAGPLRSLSPEDAGDAAPGRLAQSPLSARVHTRHSRLWPVACGLWPALLCPEAVPPVGCTPLQPRGLGGHAVRRTPGLPRWRGPERPVHAVTRQ